MKRLVRLACESFAISLVGATCVVSAQGSRAQCPGSLTLIGKVFDKAAVVLRTKTSIPPRLPVCVSGLDSPDELYAIVKSVDEDGYVVVLGATPNCKGQHVCSYGTMIGTSRALNLIEEYDVTRRPRTLVKLPHGLKGYFYASVCSAYCSDSFVTWTEGTHHYIIGLKAENKASLLASVNSAIEASGVH